MDELRKLFDVEMINIYERAKEECGYNASRFLQMVTQLGGLQAAKALLRTEEISDGFTALWEHGRLDLTMEALVLRAPWSQLFSDDELARARKRLTALGYELD